MQMNPVRKSRKLINSSLFFLSSHQISTGTTIAEAAGRALHQPANNGLTLIPASQQQCQTESRASEFSLRLPLGHQ